MKLLIFAISFHVLTELVWQFFTDQVYYVGMAMTIFLYGLVIRQFFNHIIINTWLIFLGQSVLQELSHLTGIGEWFFGDPTRINTSMVVAFFLATVYVIWKLKFTTFRK